ncbi:hypothetical protein BJ742DRAFT_737994 [Cladochytrium replicatum]|nr:hypothetical protein BJ742DRAFT_737994 [Cladochytrium replicatum]
MAKINYFATVFLIAATAVVSAAPTLEIRQNCAALWGHCGQGWTWSDYFLLWKRMHPVPSAIRSAGDHDGLTQTQHHYDDHDDGQWFQTNTAQSSFLNGWGGVIKILDSRINRV